MSVGQTYGPIRSDIHEVLLAQEYKMKVPA